MLADFHVMADLHEVVDLRAAPDARGAELGAVDAGAGADLDIIAHNNRPDLRHLRVFGTIPAIAESIAPQDASSMNDDAVAQRDALAENHIGKHDAVFPEFHIITDINSRMQHRATADPATFPDENEWPDRCALTDDRRCRHASRCVDPRQWPGNGRCKKLQHFRNRQFRIVHQQRRNMRLRRQPDALVNNRRRRLSAAKLLDVLIR